jgi:hypothetical protein
MGGVGGLRVVADLSKDAAVLCGEHLNA